MQTSKGPSHRSFTQLPWHPPSNVVFLPRGGKIPWTPGNTEANLGKLKQNLEVWLTGGVLVAWFSDEKIDGLCTSVLCSGFEENFVVDILCVLSEKEIPEHFVSIFTPQLNMYLIIATRRLKKCFIVYSSPILVFRKERRLVLKVWISAFHHPHLGVNHTEVKQAISDSYYHFMCLGAFPLIFEMFVHLHKIPENGQAPVPLANSLTSSTQADRIFNAHHCQ